MSRPLLISDCDEVLLHMVVPFRDWLDEVHGIHFELTHGDWGRSVAAQAGRHFSRTWHCVDIAERLFRNRNAPAATD